MSGTPGLTPVSVAELKSLLEQAQRNPAEMERLQADPEGVLTAMGRSPTPGALEFLRSMGATPMTEAEPEAPGKRDPSTGMAEN